VPRHSCIISFDNFFWRKHKGCRARVRGFLFQNQGHRGTVIFNTGREFPHEFSQQYIQKLVNNIYTGPRARTPLHQMDMPRASRATLTMLTTTKVIFVQASYLGRFAWFSMLVCIIKLFKMGIGTWKVSRHHLVPGLLT